MTGSIRVTEQRSNVSDESTAEILCLSGSVNFTQQTDGLPPHSAVLSVLFTIAVDQKERLALRSHRSHAAEIALGFILAP